MWVVRDFSLKLLDQSGNPITAKEYLDNALVLQKGTSDAVQNKNKIRRLITSYFTERDCFTIVRPTEDEKSLQKLEKIPDSAMRPEFTN